VTGPEPSDALGDVIDGLCALDATLGAAMSLLDDLPDAGTPRQRMAVRAVSRLVRDAAGTAADLAEQVVDLDARVIAIVAVDGARGAA